MESNILPDRPDYKIGVGQVLDALRRDTERLHPIAGSALSFDPEQPE